MKKMFTYKVAVGLYFASIISVVFLVESAIVACYYKHAQN